MRTRPCRLSSRSPKRSSRRTLAWPWSANCCRKTQRDARLNATTLADRPSPEISHVEVVSAYVGFLCPGKNDFDHVEAHREDELSRRTIGLNVVPSSPTLRQRLDQAAGAVGWEEIVRQESARLLAAVRSTVTFLGVESSAVHAELRPGKDHSQKGTPEFLRQTIGYARTVTEADLLLRIDSGFDSRDTIAARDASSVA